MSPWYEARGNTRHAALGMSDIFTEVHMKAKTLYGGALILLGVFIFPSAGFSVTPELQSKRVKPVSPLVERPVSLSGGKGRAVTKSFGVRIAGTYVAARNPEAGASRILTVFADGNLSSIQSIQFSEGAAGGGFSNQQGAWKRVGPREIQATILDFSYDLETGNFLGISVAHYNLQFDKTFRTVSGTVEGKVFSPGIDPMNPGNAEPIAEFSDSFEAQRVTVSKSTTEEDS